MTLEVRPRGHLWKTPLPMQCCSAGEGGEDPAIPQALPGCVSRPPLNAEDPDSIGGGSFKARIGHGTLALHLASWRRGVVPGSAARGFPLHAALSLRRSTHR